MKIKPSFVCYLLVVAMNLALSLLNALLAFCNWENGRRGVCAANLAAFAVCMGCFVNSCVAIRNEIRFERAKRQMLRRYESDKGAVER